MIVLTVALAIVRRRSPLDIWNVLDAQWYTGIAAHGYAWSLDGKPALAFFPLYPALIHLGMGLGIPAVAAGLVISNLCTVAALWYLRALVRLQWGSSVARRAVWLMAVFPTAFFTFAPYSEALFLLAAAAVLYHCQRGQIAPAGLWLAVAVLTRSTGLILVAPLLMSVLWRRPCTLALAFGPALCAAGAYAVYILWERLPLWRVVSSEERWHRSLTYPWTGFSTSVQYLAHHAMSNAGWTAENLLQLATTIVFLGLTYAAWRYLPPPAVVYCVGFWLIVLCTPEWRDGYFAPFSSVDRFVLALFPIVGWAAVRLAHRPFMIWIIVSSALMTGAAAVHLSGGWVG